MDKCLARVSLKPHVKREWGAETGLEICPVTLYGVILRNKPRICSSCRILALSQPNSPMLPPPSTLTRTRQLATLTPEQLRAMRSSRAVCLLCRCSSRTGPRSATMAFQSSTQHGAAPRCLRELAFPSRSKARTRMDRHWAERPRRPSHRRRQADRQGREPTKALALFESVLNKAAAASSSKSSGPQLDQESHGASRDPPPAGCCTRPCPSSTR